MEGSALPPEDKFIVNGVEIKSRLIIGTGKFSSPLIFKQALESSQSHLITMAVRRVNIKDPQDSILSHIDLQQHLVMPNTSGAETAEEALHLAKIAKVGGLGLWIKLEITPHPHHLLPCPVETLKATQLLVKNGFTVLAYMPADPVLAQHLQDAGVSALMPLGAPIGTNLGLQTKEMIQLIIQEAHIPVIVDAGLGAPSHACEAMEMGVDAVLVNTAISTARHPINMAKAFSMAVQSGRKAYLAGLPSSSFRAQASSPLEGTLSFLKNQDT